LSQRAFQDWHKTLESKPDEEYVPKEVNLGPKEAKSAREVVIRPRDSIPAWPGWIAA
jgi:hypothetical protein